MIQNQVMKKGKLKSLVASARKAAKKDIELSIVSELNEVAEKLGQDSKKVKKKIAKGARKLAKQLSKALKIDKTAVKSEVAAGSVVTPEVEEVSVS